MSKISELSDGGVIQGGDTLIAVRSGGNVKVTYGGSTTANIDGGTIDGTVIGGSTPAAGTFTTLTASGEITANGGIALGDNDKATFGDSDDLQIYHDGSDSYIDEAGSGRLWVRTSQLQVQKYTGETILKGIADGTVELYYDNALKLATTATGIDVTGTATMDGLTVAGSASFNNNGSENLFITDTANVSRSSLQISGAVNYFNANIDSASHGQFVWRSSNAYTERMRIDSSGNVGIGTDSPTNVSGYTTLNVGAGTVGSIIKIDGVSAGHYHRILNNNGQLFIQADQGNTTGGSAIVFGVDATERARIDSSGNLLVGKTAAGFANTGHELRGGGSYAAFTRDGGTPVLVNRKSSDGTLVEFMKDGTTVGSIGSRGGEFIAVGSGDTNLEFNFGSDQINPSSGTAARDNAINLGSSNARFKDLYLSGGVYLGGTGSANLLDDYETGTWTPTVGGTWTTDPTSLSGTYIKVGSLVYVKVQFSGGAKASAVAGWIDGLPFNQVGSGATGSVSDTNVGDNGNCLFANTTKIWLTDTSFSGTICLSGSYNTDA